MHVDEQGRSGRTGCRTRPGRAGRHSSPCTRRTVRARPADGLRLGERARRRSRPRSTRDHVPLDDRRSSRRRRPGCRAPSPPAGVRARRSGRTRSRAGPQSSPWCQPFDSSHAAAPPSAAWPIDPATTRRPKPSSLRSMRERVAVGDHANERWPDPPRRLRVLRRLREHRPARARPRRRRTRATRSTSRPRRSRTRAVARTRPGARARIGVGRRRPASPPATTRRTAVVAPVAATTMREPSHDMFGKSHSCQARSPPGDHAGSHAKSARGDRVRRRRAVERGHRDDARVVGVDHERDDAAVGRDRRRRDPALGRGHDPGGPGHGTGQGRGRPAPTADRRGARPRWRRAAGRSGPASTPPPVKRTPAGAGSAAPAGVAAGRRTGRSRRRRRPARLGAAAGSDPGQARPVGRPPGVADDRGLGEQLGARARDARHRRPDPRTARRRWSPTIADATAGPDATGPHADGADIRADDGIAHNRRVRAGKPQRVPN